jgi:hypothetical protein
MNCRFIHPGVNDKGNYSLISKPDPFSPNGAPPGAPHPLMPGNNPWVCTTPDLSLPLYDLKTVCMYVGYVSKCVVFMSVTVFYLCLRVDLLLRNSLHPLLQWSLLWRVPGRGV